MLRPKPYQQRSTSTLRRRSSRNSHFALSRRLGHFDHLEARLVLSSAPFFSSQDSLIGRSFSLRIDTVAEQDQLRLVDVLDDTELASVSLAGLTDPLRIVGSPHDDMLRIDVDTSILAEKLPGGVFFEGGMGNDALRGPANNSTWIIDGTNAGSVAGVLFHGFENLLGAAGNEDTFEFHAAGSIAGIVDGGAGGNDALSLVSGNFNLVTFTAVDPDVGTIDRDGDIITFRGLEPAADVTPGAKIVNDSTGASNISVAGLATSVTVSGNNFPETFVFTNPDSVTVNAGTGADRITIKPGVSVPLTINAGDEDDVIELDVATPVNLFSLFGDAGDDTIVYSTTVPVTLTDTELRLDSQAIGAGVSMASFQRAIVEATTLNSAAFNGQILFTAGLAEWVSQGPGQLGAGQVRIPPDNPVTGAIQDVAVRPFDLSTLYVGTVGGGVWRNSDISVLFEFDQTTLTAVAEARLVAFADFLKANPTLTVNIVGHTDSDGDQVTVNQPLSESRALAVKNFLIGEGIDAGRLSDSGQGELSPVDTNTLEAGKANNRRVELLVNHWTPLTDQFPTLSISTLAISPRDADGLLVDEATPTDKLVVYAGTGSTSSGSALFNNLGATTSIGILKSSDGGTTWKLLDQLAGSVITSIQVLQNGNVVVSTDATSGNGLFLSTNGGESFSDIAQLRGTDGVSNDGDGDVDEADERTFDRAVSDLAQDPGNPLRVYAAVPRVGIFVSNDGGTTWTSTNNAGLANVANAKRILLATSPQPDGPNHPLYVALIGDTELLTGASVAGSLTFTVSANTVIDGSYGSGPASDDFIRIWGAGFDGIDNDGDGLIDAADLDERPVTATDGIDNDGDGQIDIEDPSENGFFTTRLRVASVGPAVGGMRTITVAAPGADGFDNNLDGNIDEAAEALLAGGLVRPWGAGARVRVFNGSQHRLSGVVRTDDLGGNWTVLPHPGTTEATGGFHGIHPGAQGDTHFSMVVDSRNPDVVYIGGDRQPMTSNNTIGAIDFTGRLFRFNPAINPNAWATITDNGANNTTPHADSRSAVFRGMHLVEVNDGGIYELHNAGGAAQTWRSLNADLSLTEFYSIAYDPLNDVIVGGTQDIGNGLQTATDSPIWTTLSAGDGAFVDFSNGQPLFSAPNLGSFTIHRAGILNAPAAMTQLLIFPGGTNVLANDILTVGGFLHTVQAVAASATIAGALDVTLTTSLPNALAIGTIAEVQPSGIAAGVANARFSTPFVVNTINQNSLLIGTNSAVESPDLGRNLTTLGTTTGSGSTDIGLVRSLIYGGREAGMDKPTVIWVGTDPGGSSPQPADNHPLWLRNSAGVVGGALTPVASYTTEIGTAVMDIAVDPTDWRRIWVLDTANRIWFSPNAGQTKVFDNNGGAGTDAFWREVTSDLGNLPGSILLQQIVAENISGTDVVLVGGQGGIFRRIGDGPWHEYGVGLPNALNTVLERIGGADDVLLSGTFGRGAWSLHHASQTLAVPTTLSIQGSAANDEIVLRRNSTKPWLLDVFLFVDGEAEPTTPSYSVPYANLTHIAIDVSGVGSGDDDILIDGDFGTVVTTNASVTVTGGGGTDRLFITQPLDPNDVIFAGVGTGTPASGSNTSLFIDAFGQIDAQTVNWTGLNQANEMVAAAPSVEGIAHGLQVLANALTNSLADTLADTALPGIDAASLGRALNGVIVERLRPKEQAFVSASQVPGSNVIQVDNGTSVLLRLLEAGGLDIGLFSNGTVTDPAALEAALEALDTGPGNENNVQLTVNPVGGDPTITDDLLYEVHANGLKLDGVVDLSTLGDLELTGLLDVRMTLDLTIAFGFDSVGFFIRTTGAVLPTIAITDLVISGEAVGVGTLGFLGVDMSKATLSLDPGVQLKFTLGDPGVVDDNLIRADELLSPPNPNELVTFVALTDGDANPDLILNATLDVSAIVPGIASGISLASADLQLTWDDITDPLAVDLSAGLSPGADVDEFLRFLDFDAQLIVDRLTTLRDNLETLYGAEIPFLSQGVTEIVDLVAAFQSKVLDPLTGGAGFEVPSIQALIRNLAESLDVSPDQFGLAYDKMSKELTYDLMLSQQIVNQTRSLGAGVDLAGGLADLEFNTDATVSANIVLDTVIGIDLNHILGDPRDWFFLKNATATAQAEILATDIEATARFGFLSIGIDEGSLTAFGSTDPATVSVTVQLVDPDTGTPGRVDLGEILDNLGSLSELIEITGGGSLQLVLPVEVPFLPPALGLGDIPDGNPGGLDLASRSITVTIPDLSDPSTSDVVLGPALSAVGNFANIDAASIVGVLGQLTFWLDEFRRSDAFANLDLPLVGPALDEALQFADSFRDLVLIDDNDTTLDNNRTLLFDLNAAFENAGLGRKLFAANVGDTGTHTLVGDLNTALERAGLAGKIAAANIGGKIVLTALDPSISNFTVNGAGALGFNAMQNASVPVGSALAEAVAANAFGDAQGNLAADLAFTVVVGSQVFAVTLTKATTDDNTKIGENRIALVALDAGVTSFTVTGATALGFSASQNSSIPSGKFFAEVVASNVFGDAQGNLATDSNFTVTIGTKNYEVALAKSATDDNARIGDDRWKLVNGNNAPTFATAQQMSLRLLDAFGVGYPGLSYDAATDSLNFTLDFAPVFADLNLPFNFDATNLPEFLELQTSGALALKVTGGLNLDVGVFLGNAEPSDKLQLNTPLDQLNQPLMLNDNQRYDAQPIIGKLTGDSHFGMAIDGNAVVPLTVTKLAAADNTTLAHLLADINAAINANASLTGKVVAQQVPATGGLPAPQQIQFVGLMVTTSLTVTATAGDPAVTEIGLATSATATGANPTLKSAKTVASLKGRLTANAGFRVELTDGGTTTNIDIALTPAQTQDNDFPFSIINDIQTQLDPTESRVKVGFSNNGLTFTTLDGSAIVVSNVTGTATNELGIVAGVGNSDDILIMLRNGTSRRVAFDSSQTEIGQIITAIEGDSMGDVSVVINEAGSGLNLIDNTAGTGTFKVQILNNSTAGLLLGIVRQDATNLSDGQAEIPDGVIEGADIAALTALDRFFIKATQPNAMPPLAPLAGLTVEVGTPVPLTAAAKFGFVALGLQGEGGLTGAGVTSDNNVLQAGLTLHLNEPAGSTDGRVSLAEMIDALDDLDSLFEFSLTGQAQLDLSLTPATITSLAGLGIDVGTGTGGPRIEIAADMTQNVFDGNAPVFTVTTENFGELADFGNLDFNFQSILTGLVAMVDFLDDFEALSFLNEPIPVIDVSIKDLVSFAKQFGDAVTEAQNDPAGALQVLEDKLLAAFGLSPGNPALNLVLVDGPLGSKVLKIDTQFDVGFSKSLPLNLDLGLDPLQLGGDADLSAQGSLRVDLDFGFDIQNPLDIYVFGSTGVVATLDLSATDLDFKAAVGPLGVFISDGTATIHGSLPAPAPSNTVLTAGFQGAFDMAQLDEIDFGNDLSINVGGVLDVSLPVYFPTESLHRGSVKLTGALGYTNGELTAELSPYALKPDGMRFVPEAEGTGLGQLFTFDPGNLSLLDQLLLGVDGIDLFLEGLQDLMDGSIGGFELPLIGDKLSGAADAIGDFRDDFVERFRETIEAMANPALAFAEAGIVPGTGGSVPQGVDPVSKLLLELLGPGGLGVVDGPSGIEFATNIQTESNPSNVFFEWELHMADEVVNAGAGIGFDLGIPGLGLETQGDIQLTIDWALDLGFGINFADGFYLKIDDTSELELTARVTTPGLGITGRLGFLQIEGQENVEADEGANAEPERGDTGLTVQFGIDVINRQDAADPRLGFAELGRIGVDAKIAGQALVDLQMALKLNSDLVPNPGNFPSVVADFAFQWGLGTVDNPNTTEVNEFNGISLSDLDGSFLKNGLDYVGFDDIGLDLGKYFSDVIGPIVEKVQDITAPVKPFLDFLTEPIPVISDLAGPTSLLDIASMSGLVNPGIIKAIEIIDQVVDIVSDLESSGGTTILYVDDLLPGGAMTIFDSSGGASGGIPNFDPSQPINLGNLKSFVGTLPDELGFLGDALGAATDALSKSVSKMRPGGGVDGGFKLPIIEDPSQIFGMLLGQPADLVTFTMAPLELEAEFSAFFSIFGPLGVSINADFAAKFGPFTFGYDTFGITQFADSGFRNPLLLFDGLYVGDLDMMGNDVAELQFDAGLWAAAELNLGIARGGVGGGLFAEIDFNLYDPDHDGKVRIKEFITTIENEIKYGTPALSPLSIFDISGKLTAELFWFVKVDLGLFEINEKGQITEPIELLSFENVFERYPTLATELGNGVLQLNIGKNAAARIEGDLSDVGETIYVGQGSDQDHVKVWAPQFGIDYSEAQEYLATNTIIALAGEGDDHIVFSGPYDGNGVSVTSGVKLEIHGDAGNDTIIGTSGNGAALLVGGSGDDTLTGGGGGDTLFGNAGMDMLTGGDGNDWLFGDGNHKEYLVGSVITSDVKGSDGMDTLFGGDGDDLLIGGGGVDKLWGGNHHDVLIGDGGQVTVNLVDRRVSTTRALDGDPSTNDPLRRELAVSNTSKIGRGAADELRGEAGNDHLYGGFGNELVLLGGDGNDVIYGEDGTDTADGGAGDDVLFGDFGVFREVIVGITTTLEPFVTVGGEKDDLSGGIGNDKLLGGAGNDTLRGNAGDDKLWGGVGRDILWGDNDDDTGTGHDMLYGQADSDELYGSGGNDYLEGGGGNDLMLGGTGEDTLVAGYGSDTVDGQADGDTYRISVRGGSTTELTTAYDTGTSGIDSLIVVGTPSTDTLLLRAMADSYFPTQDKLDGLIERYFSSPLADRLTAMLESFNDAYGPWDIPTGLIEALTAKYQENLTPALHAVVDDDANRTGGPEEPTKVTIKSIIDTVLASGAVSKIDAMQKAIAAEYAKAGNGAGVTLPNTLFSALTAAYRPALNYDNAAEVSAFVAGLQAAIAPYYVAESLYPAELGLSSIVDQVFVESPDKADLQAIVDQVYTEYPSKANLQLIVDQVYADPDVDQEDRFDEIERRVSVVFGVFMTPRNSMVDALQVAWDAIPNGASEADQKSALQDAISDTYDADALEANDARFTTIIGRISVAYGSFDAQRACMLGALQSTWNGLPDGSTEAAQKTALKDAISDTFDEEEAEAADARFETIKSRIEAAYVDRQAVSSEFDVDEFAPQRAAMLTALQAAWDALPVSSTEAQQASALKTAITTTHTADPIAASTFTNTAFVAVINDGGADVERFNYRRMEGLVINTLGGDDYVVFDDLLAAATINLGDGNDRVQVGQVFRSERVRDPAGELITGIRAEDVYTTIEITRGWLSNGVSVPTTINGGDGDDNFTVFRNVAVLNLNGGDGDDVFTVRAFALKGSSDNERARTDMKGDGGADTILYVVNAPVGIDGGDGFDTVRIVGTEFGDDFVVTDSGVFGAGLNVSFVNIERLVADGAEGDDRFFIMSTGLDVVTEVDGGLGSDTFFVGGNPSRAPVPVVSNDLRGHSGVILHHVESTSAGWDGLAVEGLSANVGDDEEPMILLNESGGSTLVVEGALGAMIGATDTYRLRLSRAPLAFRKVVLAVVPAGLAPEDEAKNFADLEVWDPNFVDPDTNLLTPSWRPSRTIEFTSANWSTGLEIMIRAKQDVGDEGRRFTFINHKIDDATTDVTFLEAQTRSLKVQMEDDDRDGVVVVPSGRGNTVLEGGFSDTFQVFLTRQPKTPAGGSTSVTVAMSLTGMPGQVRLSDGDETDQESISLTFTTANWNTPQTVTVTAANDDVVEGFHTEFIRFDVTSPDVDHVKGPFAEGDMVLVSGQIVTVINDGGQNWLQVDGKIDEPLVQPIPDEGSTFVLLPHRPIPGTVVVRVAGMILSPGDPDDPNDPNDAVAPPRYSVTGNTITFLSESGSPELLSGKVEVNYEYQERGYDGTEVRDQFVDIYDDDTPTVIIQPTDDGMIDVVEGDTSQDTYTVRLASEPLSDVQIVIDSEKTRTTFGGSAYFEKQVLLSDNDESNQETITLTFTPANWHIEQTVTVRALDDDRLDGNDTQVFAPDLQTVNKIRGPLIIEGAAGAGSLTLPTPLLMPWELNIRPSDGNVVDFVAADSPSGPETITVELDDLNDVVTRLQEDDPTFTLSKLVGTTLEMSKGAGTDVVLDPSRPSDKFDRFWLITSLVQVPDDGDSLTPRVVTLALKNPTAVDPTQPNVIAPDADSEFAITQLSVNFFADEREQIDYLFVFDNDSVANDVGALTSSDGFVRGFDPSTSKMTVETSALQRTADLLGLTDLQQLEGRQLTITVGPGTSHVYTIVDVTDVEGDTKDLTLSSISGSGNPTDRSEFRIEGGDRYGRITGLGMGPNILFAGRPQGGGISYGDIEVTHVELGSGDDTIRVDYATNAEDHDTKRTGDFYTLTTLNTGDGDDEVTVALENGDTTSTFDGSVGDGAFAIHAGDGDDIVSGGQSTRPLVVFGGKGADTIVTGSGDDIVFGDLGRVDYTKKIDVGGTEHDAVVTRLGSSVAQNPQNPHVTFATDTTITDSAILGTPFEFPTDYEGLVGLSVQVISPEGHVQFRTVIANTADTITVDAPWDEFPVFNATDPDDNYYYRISSYPDDQTDGLFRGPRVVWSVNDDIGGNDTIHAGSGSDIVIGGAGDDPMLDGGDNADYVLGDDARFDFVPVIGSDTGATRLATITDPGTIGDDTLVGGNDVDLLIGGLGDDTISGLANNDVLIGDDATVTFDVDGTTMIKIETTNRPEGGRDTIYGGADDDLVIGGTNDDSLDGESGDDLIFGDNVTLVLNPDSGDAITPRFRTLAGTTLYDANDNPLVGARAPVPGGAPAWADWTITLDQTQIAEHFGNDYIAGGADDDQIFGQRGNDTIQGDGSILSKVDDEEPVAATRDGSLTGRPGLIEVGTLQVVPSREDAEDGDDYIEGNAGDDLIFGNLGQDDIVGGSSTLFSLTDVTLRDDASDLIFGGAGTDILRNNLGEATIVATSGSESVVVMPSGHSRDADFVIGDNGNVYRIVNVTGGTSTLRSFAYDDGYGEQLVVRAAELLDYTPGGILGEAPSGDKGAADELHGESGDDVIYGQSGDDVLFGEGQNDDLIGGTGNDWFSGGTGDDGVLGDDGRIYTSRNGTAEPLYGIASLTGLLNQVISTPGGVQQATINAAGELKKTVNLSPFSVDPAWSGADDEFGGAPAVHFSDDVIYGGLGSDSLHGGSGDDAMSGAEALIEFYGNPINSGNVLQYSAATGEFAAYDEFEPLVQIAGFLLNFDHTEGLARPHATLGSVRDDGNDRIFGDLGNDWIVGGTGRDNLYGGWGNDLLNADDNHTTNGGLNNGTDTHPTYEDRAYGGAGRDRLIANTGGDRLIDWVGEFNSYLVPFAPFGLGTVSRTLQPQLADFLYALSASDGADPTRAVDTGADPTRNGEPEGELGVVRQQDFAWREQTGAPDDPQAGNLPGGPRDVLRSANFNSGSQPSGFFADSGTWEVSGGKLQVSAASLHADAVSVYHVEDRIPSYFELRATIEARKPTAGWDANAYLIFDYISPSDFKFAGLDEKINKVVVGQRSANGWQIIKQSSVQGGVKSGKAYNMLLSVNGTNIVLVVDNKTALTHTFAPRVIDDYAYGLNYGLVGMGSNNSRGAFDNVAVQILPPLLTLDVTDSFGSSPSLAFYPQSGIWAVSNGRYDANPEGGTALSLMNLGVEHLNFNSYLELSAKVKTNGQAGFVFDRYENSFKFVAIDTVADKLIIGHYTTKKGWVHDAIVSRVINAGQEYTIGVTLKGPTVSVTLDGQVLLGHVFNSSTVDGNFGLTATFGTASFDDVRVKTNDPAFAASASAPAIAASLLTSASSTMPLMASVTSSEAGGAIQAVRESAWRWTEFAAAQTGPSASTWSDTEASRRVQIAQDAALLQFAELRVNAVRRHAAKLYDSWRLSDDPADHDDHNAIDEYQAAVDEALLSAIESGPFTS